MRAILLLALVAMLVPAGAAGEQASQPGSTAAAKIDLGANFACAILSGGQVRCWGYGAEGELGYPGVVTVGATNTPASVGPVDLGAGRTAVALSSGDFHTCAILDNGSVVCWGYGGNGRLGYGNTNNVGDTQTPGSVGPVNLGPGRTAKAISAGDAHTCAILDNNTVTCWGFGTDGQLGYGNMNSVGDMPSDTPNTAGPVDLGAGRTAVAISAGNSDTCAILDNGSLLCWGYGGFGRLGNGSTATIGDTMTPGSVGPVYLGAHTAKAISSGKGETCAILDDGTVRCWGFGFSGQLGYGNQGNLGNVPATTPGMLPPVNIGTGRTAVAISAGSAHTCAILDNASLRCWGSGADGRLGYGGTANVGDTPSTLPNTAGPVELGTGRSPAAIALGDRESCARLDDGSLRCWGYGGNGRLGYCSESSVGSSAATTPDTVGPVNLQSGDGGALCPPPIQMAPPTAPTPTAPVSTVTPTPVVKVPVVASDAARASAFSSCLARVTASVERARALTNHGPARRRKRARRRLARQRTKGRQRCAATFGRTPGGVGGLTGSVRGQSSIELDFAAVGTDGSNPPPAHDYLVSQSLRPIRTQHAFTAAPALCKGACRFAVTRVGTKIVLVVTNLRAQTTYYYAVAARDNVTGRLGPRSQTAAIKTA